MGTKKRVRPAKPSTRPLHVPGESGLDPSWERHNAEWREPAQIASLWREAAGTDPRMLRCVTRGPWWEILASCRITLLVTREYEHLVMALNAAGRRPMITYFPMPHPSGLAVDRSRGIIHIASTRNPNQVIDLEPVTGLLPRLDVRAEPLEGRPLLPVRSRFFPGCLYLHDMAMVGGDLYANAVGQNAVVRLGDQAGAERVWWPRCIETKSGPEFGRNYLQLNSIAAGSDLATSYFSASADRIGLRRPGQQNFPVNRRGVVFSGATREPLARGLTRPHSARLWAGKIWVDDSGYGSLSVIEGRRSLTVARLPGWTRGLCFCEGIAFIGTSRVLPRFRQYAPGLDVDASVCGVHAVDAASGVVRASLIWPDGNQIFSVDWAAADFTTGFCFRAGRRASVREKKLFYAFEARRGNHG